jgi:hypothetical protein
VVLATYLLPFSLHGYRPIVFNDGDGQDLKYLILVVRGFNISLPVNGTRFWSYQLDLPIPRVNNNDFEVQHALNSPMNTRQAQYDFEFNPISKFRIVVKAHTTPPGDVTDDSFMFIVQYM